MDLKEARQSSHIRIRVGLIGGGESSQIGTRKKENQRLNRSFPPNVVDRLGNCTIIGSRAAKYIFQTMLAGAREIRWEAFKCSTVIKGKMNSLLQLILVVESSSCGSSLLLPLLIYFFYSTNSFILLEKKGKP